MSSLFNQSEFNQFIVDHQIIGFSDTPFTLKSGHQSHWYVNWRCPTSDVYLIDRITDYVIAYLQEKELQPDCILGVPDGATKLGVLTQFKWAKLQPNYNSGSFVLPMWRKTPKQHGSIEDRYCIGTPSGKVVLLEDVITTGGSLLELIEELKQLDLTIIATVCLSDRKNRRQDGKNISELLAEHNIPYYPMSDAVSILPAAYQKMNPGSKIGRAIELELEKYNTEQVTLLADK